MCPEATENNSVCSGGEKKGREEKILPYEHIYILGAQLIFF